MGNKKGYKFDKFRQKKLAKSPQKDKKLTNQKIKKRKKVERNKYKSSVDNQLNVYRSFLLEKFILYKRIEILEQIENEDDADNEKYALDSLINNLFIKKFKLDPGFRFEILSKINENQKFLRGFTREVLRFFDNEFVKVNYTPLTKKDEEEYDKFRREQRYEQVNQPHYTSIFNTPFTPNNKKNILFYDIFKKFREKGNIIRTVASETILLELFSDEDSMHRLYRTTDPYQKPQNTAIYFLKATRELINQIEFYQFDHLESQRRNTILTEDLQAFIDSLKFKFLDEKLKESIEHLKDDCPDEINLLENSMIKSDLCTIMGILYFESISRATQYEMLNDSFGFKNVVKEMEKNLDLLDFQSSIGEFSRIYHLGVYPFFINYLEKKLSEISTTKVNLTILLITTKYLCYAYYFSFKPEYQNKILKFIENTFSVLNKWKAEAKPEKISLDPSDRIELEILFLWGEMSALLDNEAEFNICAKIYKGLIENSDEKYLKSKLMIQLGILYRFKMDYFEEQSILNKVPVDPPIMMEIDKNFNPYEIANTLSPMKNMVSERNTAEIIHSNREELFNADFLKREPLMPSSHEAYIMYADLRKNTINQCKNVVEIQIIEENQLTRKYSSLSNIAQIISEYELAIAYAEYYEKFTAWIDNIESRRELMETRAFPYFYIHQMDLFRHYLNKALKFKSDDTYYNKYLYLSYLIIEDFENAIEQVIKCYKRNNDTKSFKSYWTVKDLWQKTLVYTKSDDFDEIVKKFLKNSVFQQESDSTKCKIFIDIGTAIADLGFLDESIPYYEEALKVANDDETKGSILNNIGSIYADSWDYKTAISYFEKALNIDKNNVTTYENLAKMYYINLDYSTAKKVFKDAKLEFQNAGEDKKSDLMDIKIALMDYFMHSNLNVKNLRDPDAKKHFLTANEFIGNISGSKHLKDNTGYIFSALSNGLDCLLHSSITIHFFNYINQTYPNQVPQGIWRNLPLGLKDAKRGKHISLGQWKDVLRKILSRSTAFYSELRNQVPSQYTDNDLEELKRIIPKFTPIRNPASHGAIIDSNKFMNNISDWFKEINEVIAIIEKK